MCRVWSSLCKGKLTDKRRQFEWRVTLHAVARFDDVFDAGMWCTSTKFRFILVADDRLWAQSAHEHERMSECRNRVPERLQIRFSYLAFDFL